MTAEGGEQAGKTADKPVRLTLHRLDAWLRKAQPGARLCYGEGWNAGEIASAEVNAMLRSLAERKFLFLCQGKRRLRGRPYLAIRSSRPLQAEAA